MMAEHYPKVYLYRRIVQAKLFIDRNFAEDIDLNNVSDEAYFSKFHFIRLFKSIYQKTPHQYLTYVRIEKAKEFLKANKPVSEVCFLVGFDSLTSFSGLFSKLVGKSPSNFLKHHQQIKNQIAKKPLAFIPSCYSYQHGWLKE
jgi:AraC-like DNA-binding protein